MQVQQASLDCLAGEFKWIQDTITDEPFHNVIAWRENEPGEFDARDLVSILTCFNVDEFPNSGDTQPVLAYEKKYSSKRPSQRVINVPHVTSSMSPARLTAGRERGMSRGRGRHRSAPGDRRPSARR